MFEEDEVRARLDSLVESYWDNSERTLTDESEAAIEHPDQSTG